jgi:hypothetical protein
MHLLTVKVLSWGLLQGVGGKSIRQPDLCSSKSRAALLCQSMTLCPIPAFLCREKSCAGTRTRWRIPIAACATLLAQTLCWRFFRRRVSLLLKFASDWLRGFSVSLILPAKKNVHETYSSCLPVFGVPKAKHNRIVPNNVDITCFWCRCRPLLRKLAFALLLVLLRGAWHLAGQLKLVAGHPVEADVNECTFYHAALVFVSARHETTKNPEEFDRDNLWPGSLAGRELSKKLDGGRNTLIYR